MSQHNLLFELQEVGRRKILTKTATATLTAKEVMENAVINGNHASAAIALTLPAAGSGVNGAICRIVNGGIAAVTVVAGNALLSGTATAGFGGVGSGGDTLTLAQGQFAIVECIEMADGDYGWFHNLHTVA